MVVLCSDSQVLGLPPHTGTLRSLRPSRDGWGESPRGPFPPPTGTRIATEMITIAIPGNSKM
eukprot:5463319-Amphidinium_carterae.1